MIVVHTRVRCLPQHRSEFVEILRGFQAATRAEAGCLAYAYVADLDDDCVFWGVEEWADEASLRAHLAAAHMNDPGSRFGDYSVGAEVVRVFTARRIRL